MATDVFFLCECFIIIIIITSRMCIFQGLVTCQIERIDSFAVVGRVATVVPASANLGSPGAAAAAAVVSSPGVLDSACASSEKQRRIFDDAIEGLIILEGSE